MARITYQNETVVEEDDLGLTLLQVSQKHGIHHIHACGGNARCSTCRVIEDPELRRYVEVYARHQETFFADFAAAYTKLTLIGTGVTAT